MQRVNTEMAQALKSFPMEDKDLSILHNVITDDVMVLQGARTSVAIVLALVILDYCGFSTRWVDVWKLLY